MPNLPSSEETITDLVIANRILAQEGVLNAFGHVSARCPQAPDRFLLSRSLSPALVTPEDIIEYDADGRSIAGDERPGYIERFIHSAIYRSRPDVVAVVHSHAREVLPYSVTQVPLRPLIHSAALIGDAIPVWDIRHKFGDTNLLVSNRDQGDDLAGALAGNNVALMRGHGFVAVGSSIFAATWRALEVTLNAAVLSECFKLGGPITYLSPGELEALGEVDPDSPAAYRGWEYWATRAGCAHLLRKPK